MQTMNKPVLMHFPLTVNGIRPIHREVAYPVMERMRLLPDMPMIFCSWIGIEALIPAIAPMCFSTCCSASHSLRAIAMESLYILRVMERLYM